MLGVRSSGYHELRKKESREGNQSTRSFSPTWHIFFAYTQRLPRSASSSGGDCGRDRSRCTHDTTRFTTPRSRRVATKWRAAFGEMRPSSSGRTTSPGTPGRTTRTTDSTPLTGRPQHHTSGGRGRGSSRSLFWGRPKTGGAPTERPDALVRASRRRSTNGGCLGNPKHPPTHYPRLGWWVVVEPPRLPQSGVVGWRRLGRGVSGGGRRDRAR
jgi:hypothetical protein